MTQDAENAAPTTEKTVDSPLSAIPPPKSKTKLNPRQKKFLDNYLDGCMTATDAYMGAYGCKKKSARESAAVLLSTNINIQAAVEAYEELETAATKRALHGKSTEAAEALGKALKSADMSAVIRAAKEILDRTGHKPKEEIDMTTRSDLNINLQLPEDLDIDDIA